MRERIFNNPYYEADLPALRIRRLKKGNSWHRQYELVVLDTPPAHHADAPRPLLIKAASSILLASHQYWDGLQGGKFVMEGLKRFTGPFLIDLTEFLSLFHILIALREIEFGPEALCKHHKLSYRY